MWPTSEPSSLINAHPPARRVVTFVGPLPTELDPETLVSLRRPTVHRSFDCEELKAPGPISSKVDERRSEQVKIARVKRVHLDDPPTASSGHLDLLLPANPAQSLRNGVRRSLT